MEYLKNEVPDLALIDLLLPKEHGADVIREIKEKYFIPIIIITGVYKEKEIKGLMEENFVEGYLEKPFSLKRLDEKIDFILNEWAVSLLLIIFKKKISRS